MKPVDLYTEEMDILRQVQNSEQGLGHRSLSNDLSFSTAAMEIN